MRVLLLLLVTIACSWPIAAHAQTRLPVKWMKPHLESLNVVANSPDGAYVAYAGSGAVLIVSSSTGSIVGYLPTAIPTTTCLAFTPDSTRLAVGGGGYLARYGLLEIWNVKSGALIKDRMQDQMILSLLFSPDGHQLVVASRFKSIGFYDPMTLKAGITMTPESLDGLLSMGISPDGKQLFLGGYTSSQAQVEVWDIASKKHQATLDATVGQGTGWEMGVNALAVSADGKAITCSAEEQVSSGDYASQTISRVSTWALGSNTLTQSFLTTDVKSVAISPDGAKIATGGTHPQPSYWPLPSVGTLDIWNSTTGQSIAHLNAIANSVLGVSFTPKGNSILTGGKYSNGGIVESWDTSDYSESGILVDFGSGTSQMKPSPDGKYLAVLNPKLQILDSATGFVLSSPSITNSLVQIQGLEWINGSGKLAVLGRKADSTNALWIIDPFSNRQIANLPLRSQATYGPCVCSRNGTIFASVVPGTNNQLSVEVWDLNGLKDLGTINFGGSMWFPPVISPDGTHLVIQSIESDQSIVNHLLIADIGAMGLVKDIPIDGSEVTSMAFTADSKQFVSYGTFKTSAGSSIGIQVWDAMSGLRMGQHSLPGTAYLDIPPTLGFSSDGNTLLMGFFDRMDTVSLANWQVVGSYRSSIVRSCGWTLGGAAIAVLDTSGSLQIVSNPLATTAKVKRVVVAPSLVNAGQVTNGYVELANPAPIGGVSVLLTSNNQTIQVPGFTWVPGGQTRAPFTVTTWGSTSLVNGAVNAQSGSSSASCSLTVLPLPSVVTSLVLQSTAVTGGNSLSGTVTISAPGAVGGTPITLSATGGLVSLPATVVVLPGQTTYSFTIITRSVQTVTQVTVSATTGTKSVTANLEIDPKN